MFSQQARWEASTSRPVHTLINPSAEGGSGSASQPSGATVGVVVDGFAEVVDGLAVVVRVDVGVSDPPHAAAPASASNPTIIEVPSLRVMADMRTTSDSSVRPAQWTRQSPRSVTMPTPVGVSDSNRRPTW
jgi:hypothetical protein